MKYFSNYHPQTVATCGVSHFTCRKRRQLHCLYRWWNYETQNRQLSTCRK